MKTRGWRNRKARKCWHQGRNPAGETTSWIVSESHDPSYGKNWVCVGCNQRWYLY